MLSLSTSSSFSCTKHIPSTFTSVYENWPNNMERIDCARRRWRHTHTRTHFRWTDEHAAKHQWTGTHAKWLMKSYWCFCFKIVAHQFRYVCAHWGNIFRMARTLVCVEPKHISVVSGSGWIATDRLLLSIPPRIGGYRRLLRWNGFVLFRRARSNDVQLANCARKKEKKRQEIILLISVRYRIAGLHRYTHTHTYNRKSEQKKRIVVIWW